MCSDEWGYLIQKQSKIFFFQNFSYLTDIHSKTLIFSTNFSFFYNFFLANFLFEEKTERKKSFKKQAIVTVGQKKTEQFENLFFFALFPFPGIFQNLISYNISLYKYTAS